MEPHSESGNPLVPRNAYMQAVLKELNAVPYDPEHHNGMRNPYSHEKINCEDDYNEYVREYVYYRLYDEFLKQQYSNLLAFQTNQLTDQLEAQHKHELELVRTTHEKELARYIKISRWIRLWTFVSGCLALLLVFMIFWYTPAKESAKYAEGSSEGYREGYVIGYAEARQDNSGSSYENSHTSGGATMPKAEISVDRTVYVSRSGHKTHLKSDCSGMKYYDVMSYGEACAAGYAHCQKCF